MAKPQTELLASGVAETTIFVRLVKALRVFTGRVWLSNGLAKVFEKSNYDIGFFSFNLVDKSTARGLLTDAAHRTGILGIATRLAAVGALLLIGPVWIMLWHAGHYLWEYPADDLLPLVLLAIGAAGRHRGFDSRLAAEFGNRWPL